MLSLASLCRASTSCQHLTCREWFRRGERVFASRDFFPSVTPALGTNRMATKNPPVSPDGNHAATAVLQVAERLYAMDPEWVVFFREVLGVDGIVRRTFGDADALMRFECSPQYARIREMLDSLRSRQRDDQPDRETQRVVTVRMPRSLHESLKSEAGDLRVSINTLCISKLMKVLDAQEKRGLSGDRQDGPEASGIPAPVLGSKKVRIGADL
jgi:predicted HicB family RNase H-like nuclease